MAVQSAIATRRVRAVESFGNAATAIGPVGAGASLFIVTRGQWSMIDGILHVLESCRPPVALSLWTWTVAEYEVEVLTRLRIDKRLGAGVLVIDGGARVKNAGIIREWQSTFGPESVRYVRNHAKIAMLQDADGLRFLLRGSMNLNFNPRFEQFDLTEGGEDFALVERIQAELPILADDCDNGEFLRASKLSDAFDQSTLQLFGAVPTWRK